LAQELVARNASGAGAPGDEIAEARGTLVGPRRRIGRGPGGTGVGDQMRRTERYEGLACEEPEERPARGGSLGTAEQPHDHRIGRERLGEDVAYELGLARGGRADHEPGGRRLW